MDMGAEVKVTDTPKHALHSPSNRGGNSAIRFHFNPFRMGTDPIIIQRVDDGKYSPFIPDKYAIRVCHGNLGTTLEVRLLRVL